MPISEQLSAGGKYIRYTDDTVFLFFKQIRHSAIVDIEKEVISAGSYIVINSTLLAYGESLTLKVRSLHGDKQLISRVLKTAVAV